MRTSPFIKRLSLALAVLLLFSFFAGCDLFSGDNDEYDEGEIDSTTVDEDEGGPITLEEFLARFDEMIEEFGEDPGMTFSPEGYTFQEGAMVEPFFQGALALDLYGMSDPVPTQFGFHIILRLPVLPDEPATASHGPGPTITQLFGMSLLDDRLDAIMETLDYVEMPIVVEIIPSEIVDQVNADEPDDMGIADISHDTVILEIGDDPVFWDEFYYDIQTYFDFLTQIFSPSDWSDEMSPDQLEEGDAVMTYNEYIIDRAKRSALERRTMRTLFADLGLSLDEDLYTASREMFMAQQGMTEQEYIDALREAHFTERFFIYMTEINHMHQMTVTELGNQDMSDDELQAFAQEHEFLRAKHILIGIEERTIEEAEEIANDLVAELRTLIGRIAA